MKMNKLTAEDEDLTMTREEAIKEAYGIPVNKKQHEALQILIPELKESEDERIIRFFAELATDACGGPGQEHYEEFGLNYDKVMTWLEKQKEQKPSIFPPGFGEVRWNPVSSVQRKPIFRVGDTIMAKACIPDEYVKKFKALCDGYEIKLPNREYDIYHLCDDLAELFGNSNKQE